jgi:hypothetical protein
MFVRVKILAAVNWRFFREEHNEHEKQTNALFISHPCSGFDCPTLVHFSIRSSTEYEFHYHHLEGEATGRRVTLFLALPSQM